MSRHGSAVLKRGPRRSTVVTLVLILGLVAAGWYVAGWRPITASASSLAASRAAHAAATPVTSPVTPPARVSHATRGQPSTTSSDPTITTTPAAQGPVASSRLGVPVSGSHQPCRPVRFTMPALGLDASIVSLSLTADGDLGTPRDADRASAGWFPSVLAGAGRGTVLMDGHTYRDGSALFTVAFKQQVRTGMVMRLTCTDGYAFNYRVSEITLDVSAADYPTVVTSRSLYSAEGPSQLVMVTCTDYLPARQEWANRAIIIATPMS